MQYKNITIIGTSHISKKSVNDVKEAIINNKPDLVAVELDKNRLQALLTKQKNNFSLMYIKRIGLKGYLFSLLGAWAEKKLGKLTGVSPGQEMITAVKLAKKNKIPIAFIDQNIEITLKQFSKAITWKEKWHFLQDIFKSVFCKKKLIPFDLNSVPEEELIEKLIQELKKRYPSIHRVLIRDRNKVISKKLFALMPDYKNILAIMGAGHQTEVIELIKDREAVDFSQQIKKE